MARKHYNQQTMLYCNLQWFRPKYNTLRTTMSHIFRRKTRYPDTSNYQSANAYADEFWDFFIGILIWLSWSLESKNMVQRRRHECVNFFYFSPVSKRQPFVGHVHKSRCTVKRHDRFSWDFDSLDIFKILTFFNLTDVAENN